MTSLVDELIALTSKQQNWDAEYKAKVADLQERNKLTKQELSELYEELKVLEDEQHEYFRHISELRSIGNEYQLRIMGTGLSLSNNQISHPAANVNVHVAAENTMAADSLLAELDTKSQSVQKKQEAEPHHQRSSSQGLPKSAKFRDVPYSYCYMFNNVGHCAKRDCRYKHEKYYRESDTESAISHDGSSVLARASSNNRNDANGAGHSKLNRFQPRSRSRSRSRSFSRQRSPDRNKSVQSGAERNRPRESSESTARPAAPSASNSRTASEQGRSGAASSRLTRERSRSDSRDRDVPPSDAIKGPLHEPTVVCENFLKGVCYRGHLCSFIHPKNWSY